MSSVHLSVSLPCIELRSQNRTEQNTLVIHFVHTQCYNRDILAGWCDTGSIFVADVSQKNEIDIVEDVLDDMQC